MAAVTACLPARISTMRRAEGALEIKNNVIVDVNYLQCPPKIPAVDIANQIAATMPT